MSRPRFAIVFAEEDDQHCAAAAAALDAFALTVTPLRACSVLDPGAPALLIWTAQAMRHDDLARALLADVIDVVLWRPRGSPAPRWLAHAYPVGPEMPARTVAVMARLAVAESERRVRIAGPRPRAGRFALGLAACGGVALLVAGAAMLVAMREETHATGPVVGLRGMQ